LADEIDSMKFAVVSRVAVAHRASLISEMRFPGGWEKDANERTYAAGRKMAEVVREIDGAAVCGLEVVEKKSGQRQLRGQQL
jgi:hypothetical protein